MDSNIKPSGPPPLPPRSRTLNKKSGPIEARSFAQPDTGTSSTIPRAHSQGQPISVNKKPVLERTIETLDIGHPEIENKILEAFDRLNQAGIQLVESALNNDSTQADLAINEIDSLSNNASPPVQAAVAVEISALSRISQVWEEYKTELLATWDSFYHKVEGDIRNVIRGILTNGLGPPEPCTPEIAKKCSIYTNLNAFANYGILEMALGAEQNPDDPLYQLPKGYLVATSMDLPDAIKIKEPTEKLAEGAGLTFNEHTGLIKTAEGLKAMLFLASDGKMILSFAGTEGKFGKSGTRLTRGMVANFQQNILGGIPEIYSQAKNLVSILHEKYGDKLILTGFSQGGALAQYAGLSVSNNIPIMAFNSAGIGFGLLKDLITNDPLVIKNAEQTVENFNLEGELVDSLLRSGVGGILLGNLHQIPVPQEVEWSSAERHSIEQVNKAATSFIKTNPPS